MAPMKRPAAAAAPMKRPAADMIPPEENAEDNTAADSKEDTHNDAIMKRPAAAPMKRPAADMIPPEEEDTPNDAMMKRPAAAAAAAPMKRPAADEDNAEDNTAATKEDTPNDAMLARTSANDVRKQQRLIDRIISEGEMLAQKIKDNRSRLKKAEKEMEPLKEVASQYGRKVGAKRAAISRKKKEAKAQRASIKQERAEKAFAKARKMVLSLKKAVEPVKEKADTAENAYKKAQNAYADAVKLCKQLAAQGEDVPSEGQKDFSAPWAFKPPGVRAAKERDAIKATLPKLKENFEKFHKVASARLQRMDSLKAKMAEAKRQQQEMEA